MAQNTCTHMMPIKFLWHRLQEDLFEAMMDSRAADCTKSTKCTATGETKLYGC